MVKTIQIELAERSCAAGLRYAQKQLSTPPKDAVICCEGMCLKGETARRAANLIAHNLVLTKQCVFATVVCWKKPEACGIWCKEQTGC